MEIKYQEAPWQPSDEAAQTVREALQAVAKDPVVIAAFATAKNQRETLEAIGSELQDQPGDDSCPAQRSLADAVDIMAKTPSPANARAAFEAYHYLQATRELFGGFSRDCLNPMRKTAAATLDAGCRAVLDAAREKLVADHHARATAISKAAASSKIDMSSELRAAAGMHAEALRALNENLYIHGPGEFCHSLGLSI